MRFLSEFKQFALRGNVVDLAVAVVIGGAFGKIITALVNGIIMPLIGILLGGINISEKLWRIGLAEIKWGLFLQNIIDFTLIAFAIFLTIKFMNLLKLSEAKKEPLTKEEQFLMEIRDLLKHQNEKPSS